MVIMYIPVFWLCCTFVAVEGSEEELQARPVYVAAVDLSCK